MATQRTVELLKKSAVDTTLAAAIENKLGEILWTPVGDFGTTFTITERNQVGFDSATKTYWAWLGEIPHTVLSTDTPNTTEWKDVTQSTLSSLLVDPAESGNRVARMAINADSLKDLVTAPRIDGRQYSVKGFYADTDVGGGMFYWDASRDKADHTGATVIDPDRIDAWDGTQGDLATLFTVGSGSGCFVRINYERLTPEMLGAISGYAAFNHIALEHLAKQDWPVDWGRKEYGVSESIGNGITKLGAIDWISSGCRIYADSSATHNGETLFHFAIFPLDHSINGKLVFDANFLRQGSIWLENKSSTYCHFYAKQLHGINVRRFNTGSNGNGIFIEGAFYSVVLESPVAKDIRMPTGTGNSTIVGVTGISVTRDNNTGLGPLYTRIVDPYIENVESEDLDYDWDQDGIKVFSTGAVSAGAWSNFDIIGGTFKNCFGRSIKAQTSSGKVEGSHFIRDRGLNSGTGNSEISAQGGPVNVRDITFEYDGFEPGAIVAERVGAINQGSCVIDGINGVVKNAVLGAVIGTYSPQTLGVINAKNITVKGSATHCADFIIPNSGATLNLENVYIDEVQSELVLVRSGGHGTVQAGSTGIINVRNAKQFGALVPMVTSRITSVSANCHLTVTGDTEGFTGNGFDYITEANPAMSSPFGMLTSNTANVGERTTKVSQWRGHVEFIQINLDSGETQNVNLKGRARYPHGMLLTITSDYRAACGMVAYNNGTISDIAVGGDMVTGNTTEPTTGDLRVWTDGDQGINIKNTGPQTWRVSILIQTAS